MITVEQLVERFEDAVSAAEQREIELRAIRDELRGIRDEVAGVRVALERAAEGLKPPFAEPLGGKRPHRQPDAEEAS